MREDGLDPAQCVAWFFSEAKPEDATRLPGFARCVQRRSGSRRTLRIPARHRAGLIPRRVRQCHREC